MNESNKTRVVLVDAGSYDPAEITFAIKSAIDELGGISTFVRPGMTVLIKPNLLAAAPPRACVTTHFSLVQAVIRLVHQAGGRAIVGDSPALQSTEACMEASGIARVIREEKAEMVTFKNKRMIRSREGSRFREFYVAGEALSADAVINLAKAKTHALTGLTLAVKNLFGFIIGKEKALWHLRAADDPESFATMLVDLAGAISPSLSIIDAVYGMEGNGPRNGTPVKLGFIGASTDAVALDLVVSKLLGFKETDLPTTRAARKEKIGACHMELVDLVDRRAKKIPALPIKPASPLNYNEYIPGFLRKLLKKILLPVPLILKERCISCGICKNACPANAIRMVTARTFLNPYPAGSKSSSAGSRQFIPRLDSSSCIRCFCCQENCPVNAITVQPSPVTKIAEILNIC